MPRPTWLRFVGAGLALALAPLCIGSALDRSAEFDRAAAADVPDWGVPWPNQARQRAVGAIEARDLDEAERMARLAVELDPINPGAASALGYLHLLNNRSGPAQAAFQVAARGGWRDVMTQFFWLSASLAVQDFDSASARIEALVQQGVSFEQIRPALLAAESSPEGREKLAGKLPSARYTVAYAEDAYRMSGTQQRNRLLVLERAVEKGKIPYLALRVAITLLIDRGLHAEAATMWRRGMPGGTDPRVAIYNGDFSQPLAAAAPAPLDWRPKPEGSAVHEIVREGSPLGGPALRASATGSLRDLVLQQGLLLPPGRYQLTWRAASSDGKPSTALWPQVTCADLTSRDQARDLSNFRTVLELPQGCQGVVVNIWIEPAGGVSSDDLWIDDIRIIPLP